MLKKRKKKRKNYEEEEKVRKEKEQLLLTTALFTTLVKAEDWGNSLKMKGSITFLHIESNCAVLREILFEFFVFTAGICLN